MSHTRKKNLLEIKLSSWGNPFICSNWLLPHSWKFSSIINIHHLLFSGIFFIILFCTEFSWYILFWNVKYLLLTISDNSIYRFSQTSSSISHFLISHHYNLVCFISTNRFSLRGITRRLVIVFDIVQTELAEQTPHRFAGWLRPLEQCDPPPPLIPVGRRESLLKTATVESRHSMPCAGHHQLGLAQYQHY